MTAAAINPVYESVANASAKKNEKDKKRKASTEAKDQRRRSKYSKKDDSTQARRAYSRHDGNAEPQEVTVDVLPDILEGLKQGYYNTKVKVSVEQAQAIAFETRDQSHSNLWGIERRKRITASTIGGIVKLRATTKRAIWTV